MLTPDIIFYVELYFLRPLLKNSKVLTNGVMSEGSPKMSIRFMADLIYAFLLQMTNNY